MSQRAPRYTLAALARGGRSLAAEAVLTAEGLELPLLILVA